MKKSLRSMLVWILLILTLSLALFACARGEEETEAPAHETSEESAPPVTEEYFLPLEEGYNQITFYWSYDGSYENCDMWIWLEGKDGKGYTFSPCEYGGKVVLNVPESEERVGFIVRRDCSEPGGSSWGSAVKDFDGDRWATIEGKETFVYLKSGVEEQFTSSDGGKTQEMMKKFTLATVADENKLGYRVTPKVTLTDLSQVKVYCGEREIEVVGLSTLGREALSGTIEVAEALDLSASYRVCIEGYGEQVAFPLEIFDSEYFAENYHYDGEDLGAVIDGDYTTFKVWAPTASRVVLNLFENGDGGEAVATPDMAKGEKGVWSLTYPCGHGTYYTYTVTTAVGSQEAVDPYARAAGVNGKRGMVVNLSLTDPAGWEEDAPVTTVESYSDAVIWEVHVRDFSNKIADSQYKGKYLAFTERGLVNENGMPVGVDYLVELGITHVHLLPVYDYASVDEKNPDSQFNWGYDPQNYNVPEGSYSTDPYHGAVRIREFKEMVAALHEAGIGVIMDVVYNHTYEANSSLNKIVPYYYYRYTASGANTSASGCGNDTASERYMYGKFMVDSTSYWAKTYHLDGFRFDLMGLHDVQTMQEIESAVHAINNRAIIYGEGWTMGATIDGSAQANQTQISKITATEDAIGSVAVFNDVMRDGLKGSVFEKTGQGYINGAANSANLSKILFSIRGGVGVGKGWTVDNAMVINYMSAHDNNTLWDKLLLSCPDSSEDDRNRMNNLGAAILMISKGTPFWQAGEEMLRTKDGDENSYKSSDAVNNINWSVLKEGNREYATMLYYKGLIEMRKTYGIFTDLQATVECTELGSGIAVVTFTDEKGHQAVAVINPHKTALPFTLEGEWNLVADGERAGADVLAREGGELKAEAIGVRIYVSDELLP